MWSASVYASVRQIGFSLWLAVNNRFHVTVASRPCIIPRHPRYYSRFDASNFSDKLSFSFPFPFFTGKITDTLSARKAVPSLNLEQSRLYLVLFPLFIYRKGNGMIDRTFTNRYLSFYRLIVKKFVQVVFFFFDRSLIEFWCISPIIFHSIIFFWRNIE